MKKQRRNNKCHQVNIQLRATQAPEVHVLQALATKGWDSATHGKPVDYRFKDHDYMYYPREWTDNEGNHYKSGYYDENGDYYQNVVAKNIETMLTCSYCGNHMYYKWQDGMVPTCPACNAPFEIDKIDHYLVVKDFQKDKPLKSPLVIIAIIIGIVMLSPLVLFLLLLTFFLIVSLIALPFGGLEKLGLLDSDKSKDTSYIERSHQPETVLDVRTNDESVTF